MKTLLCVGVMILAGIAFAAPPSGWPELKVGDKVYHDVKVLGSDASGIRIVHDAGVARVLLKDLTPDIQGAFNYNADTAARYEAFLAGQRVNEALSAKAEAAKKEADQAERARLKKLDWGHHVFKVERPVKEGYLCYPFSEAYFTKNAFGDIHGISPEVTAYDHPVIVVGVKGKFAKGDVLRGTAARDGVIQFGKQTLARYVSKPDGL